MHESEDLITHLSLSRQTVDMAGREETKGRPMFTGWHEWPVSCGLHTVSNHNVEFLEPFVFRP